MKRRGWIAAAVILGLAATSAGGLVARARRAHEGIRVASVEVTVPRGTRIRVQVLNASRVRGLARRATQYLRDRGFDVVEIGTASELRDSTLVLDRSRNPDWAALVGEALGAPNVARPDSSRYVDVTVLLGATWRPPAEAFHP
jgi:hypothetical protein